MSQYHEQHNTSPHQQFMRDLDFHRFHNPLQPKTCYFCKVESFRKDATPTARWAKALQTVLKPPTPVLVMLGIITLQAAALVALIVS